MKKIATTVAASALLLTGAFAVPANADDCDITCQFNGGNSLPVFQGSHEQPTKAEIELRNSVSVLEGQLMALKIVANDYRAAYAQQVVIIERLQRQVERRGATIERLREKVRSLR